MSNEILERLNNLEARVRKLEAENQILRHSSRHLTRLSVTAIAAALGEKQDHMRFIEEMEYLIKMFGGFQDFERPIGDLPDIERPNND